MFTNNSHKNNYYFNAILLDIHLIDVGMLFLSYLMTNFKIF